MHKYLMEWAYCTVCLIWDVCYVLDESGENVCTWCYVDPSVTPQTDY